MLKIADGKLTVYHMPRTGGTWLSAVLRHCLREVGYAQPVSVVPGDQHAPPQDEIGDAIVLARNPMQWVRSMFIRLRPKSWPQVGGPADAVRSAQADTFEGFCRNLLNRPGLVSEIYEVYGQVRVLRTEDVAFELMALFSDLGITYRWTPILCMPVINADPDPNVLWDYDVAVRFFEQEKTAFDVWAGDYFEMVDRPLARYTGEPDVGGVRPDLRLTDD